LAKPNDNVPAAVNQQYFPQYEMKSQKLIAAYSFLGHRPENSAFNKWLTRRDE
jgi:hypothetical protein